LIIEALTYHHYFWINVPKIHTELLWQLTFLFIGLVFIYFTAIFFFRNKISATQRKVRRRKTELSPMISEFLFYEDNGLKEDKSNYVALKIEIRELLKNSFNRKVLAEILLDLQKDVSGDTQKRLFSLYQDLGLHKDAFEKLKSTRWQVVSKGILELTSMQVVESYVFITKFINDKRSTIRKQAEIATVTLKPEGIAFFLDTTKYRISEWQQLKLLDAMRKLEDFNPPRFKLWLTSRNKHVVLFALRLVKYYNQNDCNASLIELVKHKNNQIRGEAIKCIKEFNVVAALDVLKLIFWKSNVEVKISVLDAIANLGSEADVAFLKLVENKEFNFSVKSKALSAINAISPESIMPTEGLQNADVSITPLTDVKENTTDKTEDTLNSKLVDDNHIIVLQSEEEREKVSQVASTLAEKGNDKTSLKEMEENHSTVTSTLSKEELMDSLDVNFLPIVCDKVTVTDSFSEISETSAQYRPNKIIVKNEINEVQVVFEEVRFTQKTDDIEKNHGGYEVENIDALTFDFLPIVANSQDSVFSNEAEINISAVDDVMAIEVIHEETLGCETLDNETHNIVFKDGFPVLDVPDIEVIDPEVLPKYKMEELGYNLEQINSQQTTNEMKPTDQLKLKAIIEDLVVFENTNEFEEIINEFDDVWSDMEWIGKSLDMEFVPLQKEETINETDKASDEGVADNLIRNKKDNIASETKIEDAGELVSNDIDGHSNESYSKNTEEATMQLLDDIEALGDQREIPLLSELLQNEKNKSVKERIRHLISKFASMPFEERSSPTDLEVSEDIDFKPFNVFEDLFRTCDTAKKLILLDEIVAVGDEKEIPFLDSLLEDPNFEIRKKAQLGLKGLMNKLAEKRESLGSDEANDQSASTTGQSQEIDGAVLLEYSLLLDEMEAEPPLNNDIFDVGFEFSEKLEHVEEPPLLLENPHDSFLNQLWSFPNKIIEKLNG
tara:strand:- start:155061 stop:157919 length:2859 start_codon:yes stop_codon:yes gene_type:complete